ncbi:Doublesex- and mab-3-related transcription factor C1 [Sciurus carolinensis]|uniref:Doublesex- and mab-3-related transcription factor C1 n=1 Tax=Sciurus carolinensis TaxID=30640 RepID=A0AA41SSC2_SCICA|nr:Doublesex- and mab-3-related transcription factor C1 [Sciurus carolinensis]
MEPKDIPAVPCCPSDSKCTTGRETGAPWGIELGPRRAIGRCDRCHNHGITTKIRGEKHFCLFRACECHNCAFFSEQRRALPALSALKRERGARLKRHLAQGLIKTMAAAPRSHLHVKKLSLEAGIPAGKENSMTPPEARPFTPPQEESSQGPLPLSGPPEPSSVPYAAATLDQQLTGSLSGEPHGPTVLPGICSSLILQPCATPDPLLLQSQVLGKKWGPEPWEGPSLVEGKGRRPWGWGWGWRELGAEGALVPVGGGVASVPNASDQASVSAALEWQRKLEAAEALLALKNSSWDPPESISLHQPCSPPGSLLLEG